MREVYSEMGILRLRDLSWLLLRLGWGGLFLLFAAPLIPRSGSRLRPIAACLVCIGGPTLLRFWTFPHVAPDILLSLCSWTALCLLLKKTDWRTAFYGSVVFVVMGELTQIMSYDLLFSLLLFPRLSGLSIGQLNLIHTVAYLLIGSLMTLLFRPWIFRHEKSRFSWGQMSLILLPFLVYAYARNLQFILREAEVSLTQPVFQLRIGLLLLLLGFSDLMVAILTDNTLSAKLQREELRRMEDILQKQREAYLSQKAASGAIQQKYHDMKNYLLALRAGGEAQPSQARLAGELEQIMRPLESTLNTGNEYLDVILAEKITLCQQKGIELVPFADGQRLGFIDGLDLCVMVGNALDNAIEASEALPGQRRVIHLKLCPVKDMILFTVQNYYRTEPQKDDRGFYRTSKSDAENHGYGLRGISQAVEKYGGTVATSADGTTFTLSILIPLPGETDQE